MLKTLAATSIAALLATAPATAQSSSGAAQGREQGATGERAQRQEMPAAPKASEKDTGRQKTSEPGDRASDGREQKGKADSKTAQPSEPKASDRKEGYTAEPKSKDQKSAEPKSSGSRDDQKAAGTREQERGSAATGSGAGTAGRTAITTEQRQKVTTIFSRHRTSATTNINIDVNVGTRVPRNVTLVTIPEDIIVIVPHYRRYKYFIVAEKIFIVDPASYEVVEILVIA